MTRLRSAEFVKSCIFRPILTAGVSEPTFLETSNFHLHTVNSGVLNGKYASKSLGWTIPLTPKCCASLSYQKSRRKPGTRQLPLHGNPLPVKMVFFERIVSTVGTRAGTWVGDLASESFGN